MEINPDVHAEAKSKGWDPKQWVSLIPYGVNQAHPNAYKDILRCIVQNRDNLGYAWRILRDGCCDGCSLGTSGLHDWTMKGVHLCNVRLELLRLNTLPDMDYHLLEDVHTLPDKSEKELRHLGRLSVPMIRRRGDPGFQRISWDEMTSLLAEELHRIDPKRLAWYMTSRGLTNEAYYAHQKVARFIGTNHVDTSARICHAPSTALPGEDVCCMVAAAPDVYYVTDHYLNYTSVLVRLFRITPDVPKDLLGMAHKFVTTQSTGALLWSYETGTDFQYASPVVADGLVYSGSDDGTIYAFGLPRGDSAKRAAASQRPDLKRLRPGLQPEGFRFAANRAASQRPCPRCMKKQRGARNRSPFSAFN